MQSIFLDREDVVLILEVSSSEGDANRLVAVSAPTRVGKLNFFQVSSGILENVSQFSTSG